MSVSPSCIGIILDGNRRWARNEGLPTLEGHRRGYELVIACARWVRDRDIKHLAVYAFSTENWNRSQEEVDYLMRLLEEMATRAPDDFARENIRVRFVGERERLSAQLQAAIARAENAHTEQANTTLWICLSYGSRAEIVAAARAAAGSGEAITETSLRKHFWSAEMPDLDILIRPGGEKRLSNFLLWQAAYSELFFIDPYWPEFTEQELDRILREYAQRERRMGK